ncbi:MAG: hypothetical protein DRN07_06870 [Thermoplasmata archaeon]|nr:MAG: hypothetical protein DRN07_06870 [Thermoplasmata archaeon]
MLPEFIEGLNGHRAGLETNHAHLQAADFGSHLPPHGTAPLDNPHTGARGLRLGLLRVAEIGDEHGEIAPDERCALAAREAGEILHIGIIRDDQRVNPLPLEARPQFLDSALVIHA